MMDGSMRRRSEAEGAEARHAGPPLGSAFPYGQRNRVLKWHGLFASRRLFLAGAAALAGAAGPAWAGMPLRLVAFGDSLTAGYGLPLEASFPVILQRALADKGIEANIANAGVSGDTAEDGLARLDWSIPQGTRGVILELGANDALRGLPPATCERTLDSIIARLKQRSIAVLLCGMYAPRNLGSEYVTAFDGIYPRLAEKYGLPLYPFFLDGVVGDTALVQSDGLHPTAEGVRVIVTRILPTVEHFATTLSG
jgi:acyl-CoA thioesterase-1